MTIIDSRVRSYEANEVFRRLRLAVPREIVGRGTNRKPDRSDASGDQAGVAKSSDAHADVELALEQIDHAVVDQKLDRNVGITLEKIGHRGCEMEQAGQTPLTAQIVPGLVEEHSIRLAKLANRPAAP